MERIEVYKTEKAIVRLHFPDLTDEERERRRKKLEQALVEFYKSCVDSGVDWEKFVVQSTAQKED